MLWDSNPDARDGAPPFEGGASTCSAKHRDSPCLLVKGTDCAGDVLPVWGVVILTGLCAAWLRWGQSAPHTCHARYVRLGLLPVFQGEVPEVLGPLVGCM